MPNWSKKWQNKCISGTHRQYSSRLWNIKGDWQKACESTPVDLLGQHFDRPTRCINKKALGMWGEIDVEDSTCNPKWGEWKNSGCKEDRVRQFDAQCHAPHWEACNEIGPGKLLDYPKIVDNKKVISGNMTKVGQARWGHVMTEDDMCDIQCTNLAKKLPFSLIPNIAQTCVKTKKNSKWIILSSSGTVTLIILLLMLILLRKK